MTRAESCASEAWTQALTGSSHSRTLIIHAGPLPSMADPTFHPRLFAGRDRLEEFSGKIRLLKHNRCRVAVGKGHIGFAVAIQIPDHD